MAEVVIVGGEELARKLALLGEAVAGEVLAAAVRSGAQPIENDAVRRAPYKTNTLRRSIHTEVEITEPGKAEATIGTDVIYAAQREFGGTIKPVNAKLLHWVDKSGAHHFAKSVYQPPRPYLRPALDENQDKAVREVGDALRAAILAVAT